VVSRSAKIRRFLTGERIIRQLLDPIVTAVRENRGDDSDLHGVVSLIAAQQVQNIYVFFMKMLVGSPRQVPLALPPPLPEGPGIEESRGLYPLVDETCDCHREFAALAIGHASIVSLLQPRSRLCVTTKSFFVVEVCGKPKRRVCPETLLEVPRLQG
jgi:hypothetical protein